MACDILKQFFLFNFVVMKPKKKIYILLNQTRTAEHMIWRIYGEHYNEKKCFSNFLNISLEKYGGMKFDGSVASLKYIHKYRIFTKRLYANMSFKT